MRTRSTLLVLSFLFLGGCIATTSVSITSTAPNGALESITDYIGEYQPLAPLLILIGENDDWTPAEPCRKLTEAAQRAGYPVRIKIYPGAHHSFDNDKPIRYVGERVNVNSPTGRGATTGGDPKAWADSIREIVAFFDQHLRQKQDQGPAGVCGDYAYDHG
jgi:dienelactone hydrolase